MATATQAGDRREPGVRVGQGSRPRRGRITRRGIFPQKILEIGPLRGPVQLRHVTPGSPASAGSPGAIQGSPPAETKEFKDFIAILKQ